MTSHGCPHRHGGAYVHQNFCTTVAMSTIITEFSRVVPCHIPSSAFHLENHPRGDEIVAWRSKGGRHGLPCIHTTVLLMSSLNARVSHSHVTLEHLNAHKQVHKCILKHIHTSAFSSTHVMKLSLMSKLHVTHTCTCMY